MKEKTVKIKKKKTKRSENEFAALDPQTCLRTRFDEVSDMASYANTLPLDAKRWLNSFAEEECHANLNHKGEKLNDITDLKNRSRIYLKNNARNRCILSRESAAGTITYLEDLENEEDGDIDAFDSDTCIDDHFRNGQSE